MTVREIAHDAVDADAWDGLVAAAPAATPFHRSAYLSAVAPGWRALVAGDYEFAMPLPVKRIGYHRLVAQPVFARESGVIGRVEPPDAVIRQFARHLDRFREVRLAVPEKQAPHFGDLDRRTRTHQWLAIDREPDAIRAGYSTNLQRIIRKPPEEVAVDLLDDIPAILELWRETTYRKVDGLGPPALRRLESLFRASRDGGWGFGVVARAGGEIAAAAWFTRFRDEIHFLVSGMTEAGRRSGAMTLILDAVMTRYAAGAGRFDFGGSDVPSIARYFRRFGSEDRHYVVLERDRPPMWVRGARLAKGKLASLLMSRA